MRITNKALKVSDPSKLCLVIPLENGIKIQYPVGNTAEAIERYTDFLRINAVQQFIDPQPLSANSNTL